jgi:hypothetical protein
MFARVLFPTDLSAYANAIFDCLPESKAVGFKQVIMLSVIGERRQIKKSRKQIID